MYSENMLWNQHDTRGSGRMAKTITEPRRKIKMDWKDRLFHTINYTAFILFALICFYPFYYLFISTISRNDFVDLGKITFYPIGIHFQNYIDVFKLDRIGNAALVSLARTVLGSAITLLFSAYMAYIFTKNNLWGRKILYRITIATMYFSAGIIPKYLNIKMLGLMDSFWVYIIPGMISVYNMILIKTFIESLPPSLEESAQIDGAGYFTRFFRIVLPLSTPILATVALFAIVGNWNAFMDTKLYINDHDLFTLQYILYEYMNNASSVAATIISQSDMTLLDSMTRVTETSLKFTITMVTVIPVMCVYPFVQKFYVKGVMIGAVKG